MNKDVNHFCKQDESFETCKEISFMEQISMHANRHVESIKIIDDLNLQTLCKGTVVGPDAAIISEMAKEIMLMESPSEIKKYVEIGSYLGCSTFIIANITAGSNVLIYAHDIWTESMEHLPIGSDPPPVIDDYFIKFYNEVTKRKFETSIIPIRGNSNYTLNIHQDSSISLAFVDGDHSRLGCLWDLRKLLPKMIEGGIIYVHDYWTIASGDNVALCINDFMEQMGSSAHVSRVGTTTFAKITLGKS